MCFCSTDDTGKRLRSTSSSSAQSSRCSLALLRRLIGMAEVLAFLFFVDAVGVTGRGAAAELDRVILVGDAGMPGER